MYVELEETASGFFVKNIGEKATRHIIITMPKVLLKDNLFKNKDYGIYCRNCSIHYETSFAKAKKTFKELRESLSQDYAVMIVQAVLTKKR